MTERMLVWQATPVRIVVVSSTVHQYAGFDVDDLHFRHRAYSASAAYHQSKLCNVLFAKELANRYGFASSTLSIHA